MVTFLAAITTCLLVGSIALIALTFFVGDREGQIPALILAVITLPLFAAYYWDCWFDLPGLRQPLSFVNDVGGHLDFRSTSGLMWIVLTGYFLRVMVFVAVRANVVGLNSPLEYLNDRLVWMFSAFTLYSTLAALLNGAFDLEWPYIVVEIVVGFVLWTAALRGIRDTLIVVGAFAQELLAKPWQVFVLASTYVVEALLLPLRLQGAGSSDRLEQLTTESRRRRAQGLAGYHARVDARRQALRAKHKTIEDRESRQRSGKGSRRTRADAGRRNQMFR